MEFLSDRIRKWAAKAENEEAKSVDSELLDLVFDLAEKLDAIDRDLGNIVDVGPGAALDSPGM